MIFRSPYPDLAIPEDASIWNVLKQQARDRPNAPAFVCGLADHTLTFAQVLQQAQSICAGLAADGVKKGDVSLRHCHIPLRCVCSYRLCCVVCV